MPSAAGAAGSVLLACASLWIASGFDAEAQVRIDFRNNTNSLVRFASTPDVPEALRGQPVPVGTNGSPSDFRVALFWLNPSTSSFEQVGAAVAIGPLAGRFNGGSRTVPGASVTLMTVAWSGGSTLVSYGDALNAGGPDIYAGEAAPFVYSGGGGSPPSPPSPIPAGAFSPVLRPLPPRFPSFHALSEPPGAGMIDTSPAPNAEGRFNYGTVVTVNALAGPGYAFAGWEGAASGITNPFSFTIYQETTLWAKFVGDPPIANDDFANRIPLEGMAVATSGTNTNATKEIGEPNHGQASGGRSIWWGWTAPASGLVTISTEGSTFDTTLGVYTGLSVDNLVGVDGNNDANSDTLTSATSLMVTAGTAYALAVDGRAAASGSVELAIDLQTGPRLELTLQDGTLAFSWLTNWVGFTLESAEIPGPVVSWDPVPGASEVRGWRFVQSVGITEPMKFYRLRRPAGF